MSREIYYEKVERERYSCHMCGNVIHTTSEQNEKLRPEFLRYKGERLDFHKGCLWEHLRETWVPYKV